MAKLDQHAAADRRWLGDQGGGQSQEGLHRDLDQLFAPPSPERTKAALNAVAQRLATEISHTLYYGQVEVPMMGHIFLGVTSLGLAAVEFGGSEKEFLARMKKEARHPVLHDPGRIRSAADQIMRYLAGERNTFDTPVDLSGLTTFQQRVLAAVSEVPRGQVVSYAELARRIGQPRAARAVGQALGRNPIPLVIPCHRVLASDGSMGGYSGRGGVRTKRALLVLEGALL